jgi:hypothetical protein
MTPRRPVTSASTGSDRLRAAIGRLARAARHPRALAASVVRPGVVRPPAGHISPLTDWERRADERLARLERKLTSQNRLLVVAIVSAVADLLHRAVIK